MFDCDFDDDVEWYSEAIELADIDWDNLGFGLQPTDYMYIMKCTRDGSFSKGELKRFGNIELNPSAGVLNYGQVIILFIILNSCFLIFDLMLLLLTLICIWFLNLILKEQFLIE